MNTKWLKRIVPRILVVGVMLAIGIMTIAPLPVHAAADRYLKATGNWADNNTWSATDGGVAGASFPVAGDTVYITANGNGLTLTIAVGAACANLICSGANTATLAGNGIIEITGDIVFVPTMTTTYTGGMYLEGNTNLTTGGLALRNEIAAWAGAGNLTLVDNLTLINKNLYTRVGTLNTNGKTVTCDVVTAAAGATALTLGASTINCTAMIVDATVAVTANTATINCSGNFSGGGKLTYNIVNLSGATSTITGSNTFASLNFTRGGALAQTITWTDTTTQTATSFSRTGTGQITFQGSGVGGWALADSNGGTNTFNALTVSRSTALGANFNATTSSLNSGNNVGWTFPGTVTTQAMTSTSAPNPVANATTVDQGGSAIVARGFCYNTTGTPTTASNTVVVAGTLGAYSGTIPNSNDTVRFVRPYFTNATATYYGTEVSYYIPSNTGEALLKSLLRIGVAAAILVAVVRGISKNNWAIGVIIGTIAFAIVDAFINMI